MIMGVCGETRIANKRQSWVTAIQVFEYFISHHNAKAFESVFGGVSCLPGCFSMFRLKARKSSGDDWIPLIIKPEIVKEYSQSVVTTLHEKNLLLLGEDRFLTTVLLRTFPNRKMMFLPQAKCRTVVPDTFSVLLSQRRRWINSTIHNLMELVLVRNLCGTFCFSMQFVVFMDLIGTVVLPIAISLTYMLIVGMILAPPHNFEEAIPLVLLIAVLGLPAILILITTRKVVYIFWMLIYLAALPVWNFVLPVYAFWHFDDFSWGETRYVSVHRSCFISLIIHGNPGKLKVNVKAKLTERAPRLWEPQVCPCDAGKIGNVRGSARFVGRRGGGESSSACTAPTSDRTVNLPHAAKSSASTMAQTHSPWHRPTTTTGVPRLVATTKTARSILLHQSASCLMLSRAQRLSLAPISRRCLKWGSMDGRLLHRLEDTRPDISYPTGGETATRHCLGQLLPAQQHQRRRHCYIQCLLRRLQASVR